MVFKPEEYIIEIKHKNGSAQYLPVQWRLVWANEECPALQITIVEKVIDPDREITKEVYQWNNETRRSEKIVKKARGWAYVHVRAEDGKGKVGEAIKVESAVDFDDYVEKADTGATGRALAKIGWGTQFVGSEFNELPDRIVDAPITSDTKSDPAPAPAHTKPEAKQDKGVQGMIEKARGRCEKLGLDWEEFKAEATGYNIPDRELIVPSFVKINGLLTKKEVHAA